MIYIPYLLLFVGEGCTILDKFYIEPIPLDFALREREFDFCLESTSLDFSLEEVN